MSGTQWDQPRSDVNFDFFLLLPPSSSRRTLNGNLEESRSIMCLPPRICHAVLWIMEANLTNIMTHDQVELGRVQRENYCGMSIKSACYFRSSFKARWYQGVSDTRRCDALTRRPTALIPARGFPSSCVKCTFTSRISPDASDSTEAFFSHRPDVALVDCALFKSALHMLDSCTQVNLLSSMSVWNYDANVARRDFRITFRIFCDNNRY